MNKWAIFDHVHDGANLRAAMDSLLQRDRRGKGWLCALCGNGSGKDGDGLSVYESSNGDWRIHCFKCGFDGDLIDLVGQMEGLSDAREAAARACGLLGLDPVEYMGGEPGNTAVMSSKKTQRQWRKAEPNPNPGGKEGAGIGTLFDSDGPHKDLIEKAKSIPPEGMDYLASRGIGPGTIERFGVGWVKDFNPGGGHSVTGPLIPGSYHSYAVRNVGYEEMRDQGMSTPKYIKPKGSQDMPIGLRQVLEEPGKRMVDGDYEPVFIVEGPFDAMAMHEAGADAISLNGIGNGDFVANALAKYRVKRPVIVALDYEPGKEGSEKAKEGVCAAFHNAGVEVYRCDEIYLGRKDANEALVLDRGLFTQAVGEAKAIPGQEFSGGFNGATKSELEAGLIKSFEEPWPRTGFRALDGLLGGLEPGLYVLGALSSAGKTALALQMADQIAASGSGVLYYSLEMPRQRLQRRSVSRYTLRNAMESGRFQAGARPDSSANKDLGANTVKQLPRAYAALAREDVQAAIDRYFDDTGKHLRIIDRRAGTAGIKADVREFIAHRGRAPVVFIDYLQLLMDPMDETGKTRSLSQKQAVDENVAALKEICVEYGAPVIAISSLNRASYDSQVTMSAYKESGSIEYASEVLLAMEPSYMAEPDKGNREAARREYDELSRRSGVREVRLVVLKNRDGAAGNAVNFDFYYAYNYFEEVGEACPKKRHRRRGLREPKS